MIGVAMSPRGSATLVFWQQTDKNKLMFSVGMTIGCQREMGKTNKRNAI